MDMKLISSTAIAQLGDEFFEEMAETSPLTEVVMDLMRADVLDDAVPVPHGPLNSGELGALELLRDPQYQATVVFRSGLLTVRFTLYVESGMAARLDGVGDYFYRLGEIESLSEVAQKLAVSLAQDAQLQEQERVTAPIELSASAYLALNGWVGAFRNNWLDIGVSPQGAAISQDELIDQLESEETIDVLGEMAMLSAPASLVDAYDTASTLGLSELVRVGLLAVNGGGYVLTDAGNATVGAIAYPAVSMSMLTVRLADSLAATKVIFVSASGRNVVSVTVRNQEPDGWSFLVEPLTEDDLVPAIAAALAPDTGLPTPLHEGMTEWPAPMIDAIVSREDVPAMPALDVGAWFWVDQPTQLRDSDDQVTGQLDPGVWYEVLEQAPGWVLVRNAAGNTGWIPTNAAKTQ